MRRSAGASIVLVLSAALTTAVLLGPRGTEIRDVQITTWLWIWKNTGKPTWFTPEIWSGVVNMGLFLVPAFAVALLTRLPWWAVTLLGTGASVGAEAYQAMSLPGARHPSIGDVLVNSLGALAGSIAAAAWRRRSD